MIKLEKFSSIISFSFIIFALAVIVSTPSASKYEISIYDVYPWYFWISIWIPIIIPLFGFIFGNNNNKSIYAVIVLSASFMSLFMLLSLPIFRGYIFYGEGDIYSHLGMIKDIGIMGHVGSKNPYPTIHIFTYIVASFSNVTPEKITLFIRQFFVFLYVVSIVLFSKSIKCSKFETSFITAFAILPVFGLWLTIDYLMPSTEAFFIMPFVLFCIIKSRSFHNPVSYSIILIPFLLLFPFFHPESTLFLLISLIIFGLVFKIYNNLIIIENMPILSIRGHTLTPIILLFVGWLAWYSSTLSFSSTINSVYNTIILNLLPETPPIVLMMKNEIQIELIDAIRILIIQFGAAAIYLITGTVISLLIIRNFIMKNEVHFSDLLLTFLFIVFSIFSFIFVFKGTAIGFSIMRVIKYPLLISTVLFGYYLNGLSEKFRSSPKYINFISLSFVIILISSLSLITIYGTYPSPTLNKYNYQPTYAEILGMEHFFKYRDEKNPILEILPLNGGHQTRLGDLLLGYEKNKPNVNWISNYNITPPKHFGYDSGKKLGNFYSQNLYLLLYPPSEEFFPACYPNDVSLWKYTPHDFEKLYTDSTANLIYQNSEFKLFEINQKKAYSE